MHEKDGKVVIEPEDDPEQIIERMEQLIDETSSKPAKRTPLDSVNPIARKHRDAVQRDAEQDGNE